SETIHEFIFTNTMETHVVKFVFELGNTDNFNDGKFTIYEAAIYELDEESILGNEYFQDLGWRGFVNDWDGSVAHFDVVDGEYRIDIDFLNNANNESWVLQLIQDELALGNLAGEDVGVLNLEPNTTYTLSFDAYASKDARIRVLAAVPVDPWTNFFEDEGFVDITTSKATYTIDFTTPSEIIGNELFKIELGSAFGGTVDDAEFIIFDNIVVLDDSNEATNSIINGDFESAPNWTLFNENGSDASYKLTEDGLLISMTALGDAAHMPHLYQEGFNLNAGDYTLEVKITSSVDRDVRFNLILPEAGYSSLLDDGFHDESLVKDEETIVSLDFTVDNLTTNVKLEIDFGNLGEDLESEPGDFLIEYIVLYPRY
ncbi:MAG: carbohydrate binding domain-containing protein, partial [Acholeplasmataceae bacterium]